MTGAELRRLRKSYVPAITQEDIRARVTVGNGRKLNSGTLIDYEYGECFLPPETEAKIAEAINTIVRERNGGTH